jgi:arginase
MTDDRAAGRWDLIVTPWHLDEYIPAFPVPDGAAETVRPSLPAGTVPGRMALLQLTSRKMLPTASHCRNNYRFTIEVVIQIEN